jgi:hypothetical protein
MNEVSGLVWMIPPSIAYKPAPEGTIGLEEKIGSGAHSQVIFFLIFQERQEWQPAGGNLPGVSVKRERAL